MTAGGLASGTNGKDRHACRGARLPLAVVSAGQCSRAAAKLLSCSGVPIFQLDFVIVPVSSGEKEHVLLGVGHVRSTDARGKLDGQPVTPSATTVKNQFVREDNPFVERDQRAWEPGLPRPVGLTAVAG
jgi:hypothetical protein